MNKSLLSFVASLLMLGASAQAAVPLSFTHHGVLKEDDALVNGTREMVVKIVDEAGVVVASKTETVLVEAGHYSVVLENINPSKVMGAEKLTLKVSIDGEELSPALPINSIPYALVAERAEEADAVSCKGCITPDHLSFNAMQDTALPNCEVNQVLRQGSDSTWVCTDVININENDQTTFLKGKVGINTSEFLANQFGYNRVEEVASKPTSFEKCYCDVSDAAYECGEGFTCTDDQGASCYDQFGGGYRIFERAQMMYPMKDVVVVDGAKIGIGTGKPEAPLHIRTLDGQNNYEIHLADTSPEIYLEDLDGSDYKIAVDGDQLTIGNVKNNNETKIITLANNQVSILGTLNAATIGTLTINTGNLADGAITGGKIASNTIANGNIADSTITTAKIDKASFLNMMYPIGSVYISMSLSTVSAVAAALGGGTWAKIDEGFFLQSVASGASNATPATVNACLPNIKGTYSASELTETNVNAEYTGALYDAGKHSGLKYNADGSNDGAPGKIGFDASRANSIYSDSCTTVQPKSIKVYMYRRTN